MNQPLDLVGETFGYILVLKKLPSSKGYTQWEGFCSACGSTKQYSRPSLMGSCKPDRSCGCLTAKKAGDRARTHGKTNTPEFRTWSSMMTRCYNKNVPTYKYWGGRGIKVCERWKRFEAFLEDMGTRPLGKSLDRINNDGDYEPLNCRWATDSEQVNNSRAVKLITWKGQTRSISGWALVTGICFSVLQQRLATGRPLEWVFNRPIQKGFHPLDGELR